MDGFKKILIWIAILTTFIGTVWPEYFYNFFSLVSGFNFDEITEDKINKMLTGINAVLLTFIGGKSLQILRPHHVLNKEHSEELNHLCNENTKPYKAFIIYAQFPRSVNTKITTKLIKMACVLGNIKPIIVKDIRNFYDEIEKPFIIGVVCHSSFYEEISPIANKHGKVLFVIKQASKCSTQGIGKRINIGLPLNDMTININHVVFVANNFSKIFFQDVPRGLGFQGNWCGTYGIISLNQSENLNVDGKYFYGKGLITGYCEVDDEAEKIILRFTWTQESNDSTLASKNKGKGVFVMPAGFELFYGSWTTNSDPESHQLWCGARLSKDIIDDIESEGQYSKDFGLFNHKKNILTENRMEPR